MQTASKTPMRRTVRMDRQNLHLGRQQRVTMRDPEGHAKGELTLPRYYQGVFSIRPFKGSLIDDG